MSKDRVAGVAIIWAIALLGFLTRYIDSLDFAVTTAFIIPVVLSVLMVHAWHKEDKKK